jgi:hypothetical protein
VRAIIKSVEAQCLSTGASHEALRQARDLRERREDVDSAESSPLIAPKILEPARRQFCVSNGVLNVPMT